MRNDVRGSMTVLTAMTLAGILLVQSVLHTAIRRRMEETRAVFAMTRQLEVSMSLYDRTLWRDYGLHGVPEAALNDAVFRAMTDDTSGLEIRQDLSLDQPKVLANGIGALMRARLPVAYWQRLATYLRELGALSTGGDRDPTPVAATASDRRALPNRMFGVMDRVSNAPSKQHVDDSTFHRASVPVAGQRISGRVTVDEPIDRFTVTPIAEGVKDRSGEDPTENGTDAMAALRDLLAEYAAEFPPLDMPDEVTEEEALAPWREALEEMGSLDDFLREREEDLGAGPDAGDHDPSSTLDTMLDRMGGMLERLHHAADGPYQALALREYPLHMLSYRVRDVDVADGPAMRQKLNLRGAPVMTEGRSRLEVERIITGDDEETAGETIERRLKGMRLMLNLLGTVSHREKMAAYGLWADVIRVTVALLTMGQVLLPREAVRAVLVIAAAWRLARRDVTRLTEGRGVALLPHRDAGHPTTYYEDYLRVMLWLPDEEVLLTRLGDVLFEDRPGPYAVALTAVWESPYHDEPFTLSRAYVAHDAEDATAGDNASGGAAVPEGEAGDPP